MNIYDKKYQIFVSSTYTDLVLAREEVIKVVLSLYQIPIGMEMFSADNDEQWSIIQSTIDNSDYYLLILGHRYGSVTRENISYTEKEFDYAKSKGIPIISFVRNRDIATKPNERDNENEKLVALNKFLDKVLDNSMCDFWTNENELGQKVAIALTKIFFKTPRIGWVKANFSTSIETAEEITKLVQENRELREELDFYKSKTTIGLPEIVVEINNNEPIVLKLIESGYHRYRKIDYKALSGELRERVNPDDVLSFNDSLDRFKNEIDDYIAEDKKYQNLKTRNCQLNISIANAGSSKATDIYVDIKFPDEIIVIEKDEIEDLAKPKVPTIEINPVELAMSSQNPLKSFNKLTGPLISSHKINKSIFKNLNHPYRIDEKKNKLIIHVPKLTQTRVFELNGEVCIAPLGRGKFSIEISVICDEYSTKENFNREINVQ